MLSDIIEQAKYDECIQSWKSTPPDDVSEKHDPAMKKIEAIRERHMMYNNNKPHDFLPLVEGLLL
jgi:hypothetical protein